MSLMDILLEGSTSPQERFSQMQSLGGLGSMLTPTGGAPGGSIEAQAKNFFLSHGYSPQDWNKVQSIIGRESSWDPHAVNPSSGAAGIAQNINGFSQNYSRNDPMEQIRWLFNYLNTHNYSGYGTGIDAAYAHKNATGWY